MELTVHDETPSGREIGAIVLRDLPGTVTVRELIRHRVREEVARFNATPVERFNGLVCPTEAEETLNGYVLARPRRINWEQQADAAIRAFQSNGFFVLVGDRQITDLDEPIELEATESVAFVKLVPLVGG